MKISIRQLTFPKIIFCLTVLVSLLFSNQALWDLGVVIDTNKKTPSQHEIDINKTTYNKTQLSTPSNQKVRALHSYTFVRPILKEIKHASVSNNNIIKKYDEIIKKLSLKDKLENIKKSFLNKEYKKFFRIYSFIDNHQKNSNQLDLMHIQNLYYTNQFLETQDRLSEYDIHSMSDELLLYAIKTNIRLKNIENAQEMIELFIIKHNASSFLPYVIYEKKLLERNNAK